MTVRAALLPAAIATALVALAGCAGTPEDGATAEPTGSSTHPTRHATRHPGTGTSTATPPPTATRKPTRTPKPTPTEAADPRWRFYTDDHHWYVSPWFAGRHQIMVPFGCTPAPYYDPDPTCPDGEGKHHGIDVAMPCGTPLLAGRAAEVLDHSSLGPAYGVDPVLLRVGGQDVVIGHTIHVFVQPGDHLATGERFALAGDSGAPDGCHLHFEVRPAGAEYTAAVDPRALLDLSVAGRP